jgi:hypothetical protein
MMNERLESGKGCDFEGKEGDQQCGKEWWVCCEKTLLVSLLSLLLSSLEMCQPSWSSALASLSSTQTTSTKKMKLVIT